MKIGVIGVGNIGKEIIAQALKRRWEVVFGLNRSGVFNSKLEKIDESKNYKKYIPQCDVIFLAIPTTDDGVRAYRYINEIVGLGIPVVTCEKGALANYYHKLEKNLDRIGFNATVGGSSRILDFAKEYRNKNIVAVHVVLNGTMNFLFNELSQGRNPQRAVNRAVAQGYTEPQAKKLSGVLSVESEIDIPNKTSILFNHLNATPTKVRARYFKPEALSEEQVEKLLKEAKNWRYIVSISKNPISEEKLCGFEYHVDGWYISAGFKNVYANKKYQELVLPGVGNKIILVDDKGNTYAHFGIGAGQEITVQTMMEEAESLAKS
ncbi:MAG: hypothetical protein COT81_03065 [Candidatus Buchananbacteria bacterium CG10_big_fil_rev_8_21_14_0_10_42_9]|uniref:homoserine dehydrogenase n=1 Tax=Candidatus Buchananbacteria bacterium CG10_big_fil_rev_8_21_14_0_10_42_9 TaxID=1974526 RepID=A0A2H0W144_9BACT|nr:MAG: hypothetical protein COT81_03065 [Candidatus Buchananbacteria bacterium CG10_big_fil_rev_8_21_14_0_10_42_9]